MRYALPTIMLLGLILRIGYALAVFEPSLLPFFLDDFQLYGVGAEEILNGDFAFSNNLYLLRPPLFPLLVALLRLQPTLVIGVNIVLSTAIIPQSFYLARQFKQSSEFALVAAALVAFDITSIKYASAMLAEPLANVLLAFAFIAAIKLRDATTATSTTTWGLLAGAFVALSALTRPAAYLLWIPLSLWVILARDRGRLLAAAALAVAGFLGTGAWMVHNSVLFGHGSFSTIGNYNLLYYRAASVLRLASGDPIDDVYAELASQVEARLGNDIENVTASQRHQHYTGDLDLQSTMTSVAIGVFLEHPIYYVLTIPLGLYRILIRVSGILLLPGIVWNTALLLTAAFGVWQLHKRRAWANALYLMLPCAYFVIGTLLVQTSGIDTRARVMVTPLLALMSAYGIVQLLNRRRAASASPAPPADS